MPDEDADVSEEAAAASEGETRTQTCRMPMSLLPKESRRGPALEYAGTLAMTRKMLLMVRARRR